MKKLLHKQILDWKGTKHDLELYESDDISDLGFANQCQAVPFVDDDHIVIFKHIDGYYSLPGGTVEEGEKFDETLKRELMEEAGCEVLDYGLIGYVKGTEVSSGKIKYQLRYWAHVKPVSKPQDPDGKAIDVEIVKFKDANSKLNWGERGQILLDLAARKYQEHKKIKKAARTVIVDKNGLTAVIDVRGGEYYKIPGGGIEEGETDIEAAKREALEEAGSIVEIVEKIGEHEFIDQNPKYKGMTHHSICFLAKKVGEHKDPSFDEWEKKNQFKLLWVSFEEALKLFSSCNTNDPFGKEINRRDWDFLIKGIKLWKTSLK